ncbi:MAG TPA: CpXC domain-containing protein [Spirochaetales bacterium]|nr:CpXC domain-containing protein [Spirochaetales bacterium]
MRKVVCMCENAFEADLPERVDLDAEPGRLDEILAGAFFKVACPSCGAVLKPELPVRLASRKRGLEVQVLPELDRLAFYLDRVQAPKEAEVLVGYAELYERARIVADGLDPLAVEIVKYYLALKAEEKAAEGAAVLISYAGREGASGAEKLLFHVSGIKEGEVAVLHVGLDYYERTLAEKRKTLQSEPFDKLFAGRYKSIRALEAEAE